MTQNARDPYAQQVRYVRNVREEIIERDRRRVEREKCNACGNLACKLGLTPGLPCAWRAAT